jgi:hypothetical protein
MIHAYQYSNRGTASWGNYGANREVEAYLAQYRFMKESGQLTSGSKWGDRYTKGYLNHVAYLSNDYISRKGTLIDPGMQDVFNFVFETAAHSIIASYEVRPEFNDPNKPKEPPKFDSGRSAGQNINSLSNLSKNC